MFRLLLQGVFIRRLLQMQAVRVTLLLVMIGSVIAGAIYALVVYQAVIQRSHSRHVYSINSH
jgi:hypothetical protein